jgi:SpoVK/Ycf46/Vps4 family AAA+-type ATPase
LCGQAHKPELGEARTLAVRLDLEMQLSESQRLQAERLEKLSGVTMELRAAGRTLTAMASASELGRRGAATQYEVAISDISRQLGRLDAEIQNLDQRRLLAEQIQELSGQKAELNARIEELRSRIEATEASQAKRKAIAYTAISEAAKAFLEGDLAEHSDFGQIDSVGFDFGGDWIALNGVRDRVGSASGMVILKNSFIMGLFTAALADPNFGLPRFTLMDNIEDKGMVEERSWNFQRLIVSASLRSTEEHQLIFTTSKIAPELAGSEYVIGRKFTKERKTLNVT